MTGPLDVETVLVPVDGSEESTRAAEFAVAVAARYDAVVHAVYVHGEEVVRGLEQGALETTDVAEDSRAYLATVEDLAREAGIALSTSTAYGFSTSRKMVHPGSVILDTAEEIDADFLVVPREPMADEPGDVLEKAAEYVLLYASQPVLSV